MASPNPEAGFHHNFETKPCRFGPRTEAYTGPANPNRGQFLGGRTHRKIVLPEIHNFLSHKHLDAQLRTKNRWVRFAISPSFWPPPLRRGGLPRPPCPCTHGACPPQAQLARLWRGSVAVFWWSGRAAPCPDIRCRGEPRVHSRRHVEDVPIFHRPNSPAHVKEPATLARLSQMPDRVQPNYQSQIIDPSPHCSRAR